MKSPKPHRKGSTPKRPFKDEKPSAERAEKNANHKRSPSHKSTFKNPGEREERQGRDYAAKRNEGGEAQRGAAERPPVHAPREPQQPLRIAKRISDAGVCSRRMAERYIAEGRVTLNGVVVTEPGTTVTERDKVVVDGKLVANKPQEARLFLYHKPRGEIVTARDVRGRPTVFDNLPKGLPRLVSVGRLDLDSEGLLLLTTSGELARKLELPSTGHARIYRVRIYGTMTEKHIHMLRRGLTVEGVQYAAIEVKEEADDDSYPNKKGNIPLSIATASARSGGVNRQRREGTESPVRVSHEPSRGRNKWLIVTLHEGKNREIRRVFEFLGYPVNRLQRLSYGPFTLGKLPPGTLMEIKPKDWLAMLEMPLPPKSEPKPRPERKPERTADRNARPAPRPERDDRPSRDDRPRKPRAKDKGKPKRFMRDGQAPARDVTDRPPRDAKRDTNERPNRPFRKEGDTPRPNDRTPPRDGKKDYAKSDRPRTHTRDGDNRRPHRPSGKPPRR